MAAAGVCIVIAVGILGLFFVIGKLSVKARSVYKAIYNAIVWNPMIRYVLQSTLKLQMSAVIVLSAASTSTHQRLRNLEEAIENGEK